MFYRSFNIGGKSTVLDDVTDAAELTRRVPSFVEFFDALETERDIAWENRQVINARERVGMTAEGTMMRVAVIPMNVRAIILAIEPNFYKDKSIFWRWLRRHKEYQVGWVKNLK